MVSRALLLKKKTHNTTLSGEWSELTGLRSHLSGLCSLWQSERRPCCLSLWSSRENQFLEQSKACGLCFQAPAVLGARFVSRNGSASSWRAQGEVW